MDASSPRHQISSQVLRPAFWGPSISTLHSDALPAWKLRALRRAGLTGQIVFNGIDHVIDFGTRGERFDLRVFSNG